MARCVKVGTGYSFFAEKSHELVGEYINADDVIAFCLYLVNKMRRNLIIYKMDTSLRRTLDAGFKGVCLRQS